MQFQSTLVIPIQQNKILLGYKKRGFGEGKITAFGGKLEAGETPRQAAIRELYEETGLQATQIEAVGGIQFWFPNRPVWDLLVAVFTVYQWDGQPVESEEIAPAWYSFTDIPYQKMWDDARYWLPSVLNHHHIQAEFVFASDNNTVAQYTLNHLDEQ